VRSGGRKEGGREGRTVRLREGDAIAVRIEEERLEKVVREGIDGIVAIVFNISTKTLNAGPADITDLGGTESRKSETAKDARKVGSI
jgi:hypothetical protein